MAMLVFVNLDPAASSLADYVPGLLEDWREKIKLFDDSSPTPNTSTLPPTGS